MSTVQSKDKVIAILCSDIHLRLRPPIARIDEPDWFAAMARPLNEIADLAEKHRAIIYCAGDIFDKWNSPAELINFALSVMPEMWAIPGQHDLPLHSKELIKKSAFWTLVEAKKIYMMDDSGWCDIQPDVKIFGFMWDTKIKGHNGMNKDNMNVAVAHQYAWVDGYNYPDAPKSDMISKKRKELQDFDVVVFGDNHKGFLTKCGKTTVFNCGGLMRMKSDEKDYKPQVGLLYESGKVKPHYLDTSKDIFIPVEPKREIEYDMELDKFLEELNQLEEMGLDFREAMIRILDKKKPDKAVRQMILQAMEE